MVEHEILPRLRERFSLPQPPLCLRLTTFGRSESDGAESGSAAFAAGSNNGLPLVDADY